mmetsp:Transcript_12912/g.14949  ORF Transcript_12912/g.14949 Transcript_12912/m.14949 type:complete len:462 (+) Transcript_12912:2238-3623(+)
MYKALRMTRQWKIMSFGLLKTLDAHIAPVNVLTTTGSWVFSGSSDGKVKAWDTKTWMCKRTLNVTPLPRQQRSPLGSPSKGPNSPAQPPSSSSTSSRGSGRGRGRNTPPKPAVNTPAISNPQHQAGEQVIPVTALATYEKVLLIGLDDGNMIVRLIFEEKFPKLENKTFRAHNGAVKAIAISKNKIFTGGADGVIAVWNPKTLQSEKILRKHTNVVCALRVCGTFLFSGSHDTNVFVWHINSLDFKNALHDKSLDDQLDDDPRKKDLKKKLNKAHTDRITDITSYANIVYTAAWDCYIKAWDSKKLIMLRKVFVYPVGICWSMAIRSIKGYPESYLVCGTGDGDIEVRNLRNLKKIANMYDCGWTNKRLVHKSWVKCLLPLQDGRIVSASEDWSVKVWDHRGAPPVPVPPSVGQQYRGNLPKNMTAAQYAQMVRSGRIPPPAGTAPYQQYNVPNGQTAVQR